MIEISTYESAKSIFGNEHNVIRMVFSCGMCINNIVFDLNKVEKDMLCKKC
jgi:hypothetical protein